MTSPTPQRVIGAPPSAVTSVLTKHCVRISIGDTPETVAREYGKQVFRPESVQLAFARHTNTHGGWTVQKAEIIGTVIKQDGSLGKTPARRDFAADLSQAPWWLNALVETHMPSELASVAA